MKGRCAGISKKNFLRVSRTVKIIGHNNFEYVIWMSPEAVITFKESVRIRCREALTGSQEDGDIC